MPSLAVWTQIESLLGKGISVIPIRDKDEILNNGTRRPRKSPYASWGSYQKEIISKEVLWADMENFKTEAIAMVCGEVSGNLEVIDVDSKNNTGIEGDLFNQIHLLYPKLFKKLRIHKTPSNGYHIIYRVHGKVEGNRKLASRISTPEELLVNPKEKTKCFLETRGEGGYVVVPPSEGYKVEKDVDYEYVSVEERNQLINLCLTYDQVVKENKGGTGRPVGPKDYYKDNPFEVYNESPAAEDVLLRNGWTLFSRNERGIYFSRPGSKSKDVHGVFLLAKRVYYIFTTNSELEPGRCYQPATIRAILEYGGDKVALHKILVNEGYGRILPELETSITKNKVISGGALPPNASVQAQEQYTSLRQRQQEVCRYGIFWQVDEKGKIQISREDLYKVAHELGFRGYKGMIYRVKERIIYEIQLQSFFDVLRDYVFNDDGDLMKTICNCLEAFWQKSGEFTISRLRQIEDADLFLDTKDICYKFFQNGFVKIDAEGVEFLEYEKVEGLVFEKRIQKRNFDINRIDFVGGRYVEFLNLACRYGTEKAKKYIEGILGFLAHEYKDTATALIIVLTEECEDPKHGGGSGKNVFCTLLNMTTTVMDLAGSQMNFDVKFLQAWNFQKIVSISDVPRKFDYSFLKHQSGDKGVLKKLYKDEVIIEAKDMPKFIIQTNYGVDKIDGGVERRIRQIEFTEFFTQQGGVDVYFQKYFPIDWEEDDWVGFDNTIIRSVQRWIRSGRKVEKMALSATGFIKQFSQTYGINTKEFILENWEEWKEGMFISNSDFTEKYEKFCERMKVPFAYRISSQKLNSALESWCSEYGYIFVKDKVNRAGNVTVRGKEIIPPIAPF